MYSMEKCFEIFRYREGKPGGFQTPSLGSFKHNKGRDMEKLGICTAQDVASGFVNRMVMKAIITSLFRGRGLRRYITDYFLEPVDYYVNQTLDHDWRDKIVKAKRVGRPPSRKIVVSKEAEETTANTSANEGGESHQTNIGHNVDAGIEDKNPVHPVGSGIEDRNIGHNVVDAGIEDRNLASENKLTLTELHPDAEGWVNGRKLHSFLFDSQSKFTRFNDWHNRRIAEHSYFQEGKDFYSLVSNGIDCMYSVDMAKHLALSEKTKRGYEVRNYFIECEKELRNREANMTPAELFAKQAQINLEAERRLKTLIGNIENVKDDVAVIKGAIGDKPVIVESNQAPKDTYATYELNKVPHFRGFSVDKIDTFLKIHDFPRKEYTQIVPGRKDDSGRHESYEKKTKAWKKRGISKLVDIIIEESTYIKSSNNNHIFEHPHKDISKFHVKVGFNSRIDSWIKKRARIVNEDRLL